VSEGDSLTVVVPAYDEAGSLEAVVRQVAAHLRFDPGEDEIVVVDDGSRDGTGELAEALARSLPFLRVVRHERNLGSGAAILSGIAAARCDLVMYVPADGQFHLPEINAFREAMKGADIVIGARMRRSDYSWFRRLSSRVFIVLVDALFDQSFRDVNWVHMWRRRIFDVVEPRSRGVFLLEEILVRAARRGFVVQEIQSFYIPRRTGKAKGSHPATILKTIYEMAAFWLELRLGADRH
jgi:glycosyltransferase involved in cell wall biosynthesis